MPKFNFLVIFLLILLSSCAGKRVNDENNSTSADDEYNTAIINDENDVNGSSDFNNLKNAKLTQVFYFDYDSYNIRPESMSALDEQAKSFGPNDKITLHGHTDERGTREYNIALGERRAKAVQSYLRMQGVKNPISIVSYGKEMPAVFESNEAAWAKNRRVELFKN